MCVWDGTYTPPQEEREAMDQIAGWIGDAASIPERRPLPMRERRSAGRGGL